jgi:hypothetical protein
MRERPTKQTPEVEIIRPSNDTETRIPTEEISEDIYRVQIGQKWHRVSRTQKEKAIIENGEVTINEKALSDLLKKHLDRNNADFHHEVRVKQTTEGLRAVLQEKLEAYKTICDMRVQQKQFDNASRTSDPRDRSETKDGSPQRTRKWMGDESNPYGNAGDDYIS